MGNQDRWIATGKDPLKVVIENIPEEKESPKPIPVVDNLPLEDYKKLEEDLSEARSRVEYYEKMLNDAFGGVKFLHVKPYDISAEQIENELEGCVLFTVSYKVSKEDLGNFRFNENGQIIFPVC